MTDIGQDGRAGDGPPGRAGDGKGGTQPCGNAVGEGRSGPFLFRGPAAFAAATRWPVWGAVFAACGIVAAAFVAGGLVLILCAGGLDLPETSGSAAGTDPRLGSCMLWGLIGQQAAFVLLTLFAAGFLAPSRRRALLLHRPRQPGTFVLAVTLLLAADALFTVLLWLVNPTGWSQDLTAQLPLIRSGPFWLALTVIGLGAPLSEELLFRGFLLPVLARSPLGFAGAAVLTSAGWAALHLSYSVFGLIEVFLIGLYFSWLVWRTGTIVFPFVCHAVYNTIVFLIVRSVSLPAPPL